MKIYLELMMKNTFNKIEKYYQENREFLDLIHRKHGFGSDSRVLAMNWYYNVKDGIDIVLGDKVSLSDIEEVMLKEINSSEYSSIKNYDYDESGYATKELVKKINNFWKKLNDESFKDMIYGKIEFDLDGGRSYLATNKYLIVNYVIQTLNMSYDEIEDNLYNDNEYSDTIFEFLNVPTDLEFLNKNCDEELAILKEEIYNSYITVKYPINMKISNSLLKFIKKDSEYNYYTISIPKGLTVVD